MAHGRRLEGRQGTPPDADRARGAWSGIQAGSMPEHRRAHGRDRRTGPSPEPAFSAAREIGSPSIALAATVDGLAGQTCPGMFPQRHL
jgi:hypothetical protein